MAITAVQRKAKGAITASLAIGSGDGWATPTSGNLLVVMVSSDATVTAPSGSGTWSAGPSVVDNNAAYSWYKVSAGTETTITCAPSVSTDIAMTVCEYSGTTATPFDVQNSSTISASPGGTTTTAVSVTTTTANGLIVAGACLGGANNTANPTGATWTGSLTNVVQANSQASITSAASACSVLFGELLDAGATGAHSQGASWTNGFTNRQELVIGFKAAAVAAAEPVIRRRPHRGLYMR